MIHRYFLFWILAKVWGLQKRFLVLALKCARLGEPGAGVFWAHLEGMIDLLNGEVVMVEQVEFLPGRQRGGRGEGVCVGQGWDACKFILGCTSCVSISIRICVVIIETKLSCL